jgi:hypothetical protein
MGEEISWFEVLNGFFGGLEASSVAIFDHKNCTVPMFFN